MAELNGLKVFYIKCNESLESNQGIDFISLVDCPAIETNWVALSSAKARTPLQLKLEDDQRLLIGPVLIPDFPIYRNDEINGEHYVVFQKEEIVKLTRKFQALQKTVNLNLQHKDNSKIDSAVIQETWLTGKNDKSKDYGFELPEGTWMICSHIGDEDFWKKQVKSGNVRGYSMEGYLDMELKAKSKMSKSKFEIHKQADGGCDVFIDGPVAVDSMVFSNYPSITLVNGIKQITQYPIWQELIVLEDGTILTLKDSKILKVETKTTQSKQSKMKKLKFTITATAKDGTVMSSEDSEFKMGSKVTMLDAQGKVVPVVDGNYEFDNGDTVTVKDGMISVYNEYTEQSDELSEAEVTALKKSFGIDKLENEIKELRIAMKIAPGTKTVTGKDDDENKPDSPKSKFDILRKFAQETTKKQNTK